jgi:hypothetical protein
MEDAHSSKQLQWRIMRIVKQRRWRICCWQNSARKATSRYGDFDLPWPNLRVHCWIGPKLEHSFHFIDHCYRERKTGHLAPPSFSICFAFLFLRERSLSMTSENHDGDGKGKKTLCSENLLEWLGMRPDQTIALPEEKWKLLEIVAYCESQSSFQSW